MNCERYVSSKTIQQKMDVGAKTVRNWAEKYGWRKKVINPRVFRYCAKDVEDSLNVNFS